LSRKEKEKENAWDDKSRFSKKVKRAAEKQSRKPSRARGRGKKVDFYALRNLALRNEARSLGKERERDRKLPF